MIRTSLKKLIWQGFSCHTRAILPCRPIKLRSKAHFHPWTGRILTRASMLKLGCHQLRNTHLRLVSTYSFFFLVLTRDVTLPLITLWIDRDQLAGDRPMGADPTRFPDSRIAVILYSSGGRGPWRWTKSSGRTRRIGGQQDWHRPAYI